MKNLLRLFPAIGCRQQYILPSLYSKSCFKHFHTSETVQSNSHHKTRLELICELNKTLYIHRNAEFGIQPIFYRGNKKVDLWERHKEKLRRQREWQTFSRYIDVMEKPVDNVYLKRFYKPKVYSIKEGVHMLKEYARLDMIDAKSLIFLKLDLKAIKKKAGKGKHSRKNVSFFKTTDLPYPIQVRNKVCLFTDNEELADKALKMGVCAAGSSDLTVKVLNKSVQGEIFFSTPSYVDELGRHKDLKKKLGKHFPSKAFGITDDLELLKLYVTKTTYNNFVGPSEGCKIKVGKLNQSITDIVKNIKYMLKVVDEEDTEGLVKSASIICSAEPLLIDVGDVLKRKS